MRKNFLKKVVCFKRYSTICKNVPSFTQKFEKYHSNAINGNFQEIPDYLKELANGLQDAYPGPLQCNERFCGHSGPVSIVNNYVQNDISSAQILYASGDNLSQLNQNTYPTNNSNIKASKLEFDLISNIEVNDENIAFVQDINRICLIRLKSGKDGTLKFKKSKEIETYGIKDFTLSPTKSNEILITNYSNVSLLDINTMSNLRNLQLVGINDSQSRRYSKFVGSNLVLTCSGKVAEVYDLRICLVICTLPLLDLF